MKTSPNQTLSGNDIDRIFALAEKWVGAHYSPEQKQSILLTNVMRRLAASRMNVDQYLAYLSSNDDEKRHFISALTIHTTRWFREKMQLDAIMQQLKERGIQHNNSPLTILSAACSTGEEVYTLGLMMEQYRCRTPGFEYRIHGFDIDSLSVETAKAAIYTMDAIGQIPPEYKDHLLVGSGRTTGYFTLSKDLRQRCSFAVGNLKSLPSSEKNTLYDIIFCRNVLIYFSSDDVRTIIHGLSKKLRPDGYLCVGHSETFDHLDHGLNRVGHAIYHNKSPSGMAAPIKTIVPPAAKTSAATANDGMGNENTPKNSSSILVVDDSPTIRKVLRRLFESGGYQVYDVESGPKASAFLKDQKVDLISLDLHMPEQDGLNWYREQRGKGLDCPVIIVSDSSPKEVPEVLEILSNGAEDYFEKKLLAGNPAQILEKIRSILNHRTQRHSEVLDAKVATRAQDIKSVDLILVGASTGGTQALTHLLKGLPQETPPVLVVQHIGEAFLKPFADRLAQASGLKLDGDQSGTTLKAGHLYMAQSDHHIGVKAGGNHNLILQTERADNGSGHRPSVDYLFHAVAKLPSCQAAAILLTGMGKDGALGMKALYDRKALTFAQDAKSCVVFGMPREAIRLGGAGFVGDLPQIRFQLDQIIKTSFSKSVRRAS